MKLIRADALLTNAQRETSQDGYTSWPAYAAKLETLVRTLAADVNLYSGAGAIVPRGSQLTTIILGDAEVPAEYEYDKGDPGCWRTPNGDGWPEIPPSVCLLNLYLNGKWCDAQDVLSADRIERIETDILEQIGDDLLAAAEEASLAQRERMAQE